MKSIVDKLLPARTADPGSPSDGLLWLRNDTKEERVRLNGVTYIGGPNVIAIPFTISGTIYVATGALQIPVPFNCELASIVMRLATAPTGAAAIVDVNYDGTTIFGTQANRPTVAISGNTAAVGAASVTAFTGGNHYWSFDIDQVGSTIAGSYLSGLLLVKATA